MQQNRDFYYIATCEAVTGLRSQNKESNKHDYVWSMLQPYVLKVRGNICEAEIEVKIKIAEKYPCIKKYSVIYHPPLLKPKGEY